MTFALPQTRLALTDVAAAAGGAKVRLSAQGRQQIVAAQRRIARIIAAGKPVYGVNTGFGALADKAIPPDKIAELQVNLIRSHAAGAGNPLRRAEVRAAMFLRANMLSKGFSGVSPELVGAIIDLLNHDIVPVVPETGSVGASGDLAPLAHIALALLGRGEVFYKGRRGKAAAALKSAGLQPHRLQPKEGLSLINGTEVMAALGTLGVLRAERIAGVADLAGALTAAATGASPRVFEPDLHRLKDHRGQAESAGNVRAYLRDADFDRTRVQDAYSIRCLPQVHGAAREGIAFARRTCEIEINSVTDNPVLLRDTAVSGGNFHGAQIALALDTLAIALTQLAAISERRTFRLLDPKLSGLPAFLVPDPGLNSGLMIAQMLAASLVTDCKLSAAPASVHSLPTSAGQEDFVSMGMNSALKARRVNDAVETVLAVELLCACQALELSKRRVPPALRPALARIRSAVPPLRSDRELAPDIESVRDALFGGLNPEA